MNTIIKTVPLLLFSCLIIGMASPALPEEQFNIICNKAIPQESLSSDEIKQIFLGRKTRWSDNHKINFIILENGDIHTQFLKKYIFKTPSQYLMFWKKMVFTGQGALPKYVKKTDKVLEYVSLTPGAIGYVPDNLNSENVKTINVIP